LGVQGTRGLKKNATKNMLLKRGIKTGEELTLSNKRVPFLEAWGRHSEILF